ncbi:endo-1,4-beta-xylanase, partial [Pelobium sp.]
MKRISIFASVLLLTFSVSCSKKKAAEPVVPPVIPPPISNDVTLKGSAPFPWGAAISVGLMKSNTLYNGVVTKETSSITPENAMKFGALHPSENTYNWTDADYLVSYAQANGKRVHGHTLIWHNSLPNWVTNYVGDAAAWEAMFKSHIQTVVTHFKGKVASWDVVNEAIADDGSLRSSIWLTKIGPDYIAKAFRYAREADPDVLLFYNDYGNEYSTAKRNGIINLVTSLKNSGVPIDGIGMQMHTSTNISDSNQAAAINTAAATGLKVHISEIEVSLNPTGNQSLTYTAALGDAQAAKYKFIVKTYNALPASQKYGITTWNVGDTDSWIPKTYNRPDWPLPFDYNYARKAAYQGILDGFK